MGAGTQKSGGAAALPAPPPPRSLFGWHMATDRLNPEPKSLNSNIHFLEIIHHKLGHVKYYEVNGMPSKKHVMVCIIFFIASKVKYLQSERRKLFVKCTP